MKNAININSIGINNILKSGELVVSYETVNNRLKIKIANEEDNRRTTFSIPIGNNKMY